MGNCITIAKGMKFWGSHGLHPEENKYGARFEVDVEGESDETAKCQDDSYEGGLSYLAFYDAAEKVVTTERHAMIQRIAQRIADEIFDKCPTAEKLTVTVRKPSVPLGGILDYTACTIVRTAKGANSDGNAKPYTGINPLVDDSYAYANNAKRF